MCGSVRFQAYADFLTRARTFRNAVESFYRQPHRNPSLKEIDSLLQSTNDASALVFLVVEDDTTHEACRHVLRALSRARAVIHRIEPLGPAVHGTSSMRYSAALLANSRTPHGTNWESPARPNRGTSPGSSGKTEGGQPAGRCRMPRTPRVTRQAAASRE